MLIKCLFTDTHTMVRVRKIALMGFPAVGKSSLMYRFVEGRFDETYTTTIETRLETDITVGTKDFKLVIYDTMGVTEMPNFPDDYLVMDGWIMVFSVEEPRSLDVVRQLYQRLEDAGCHIPPIVVVGNKVDLGRKVSAAEGRAIAEEINGRYVETSVKESQNVKEVFELIIREIERKAGDPIRDSDSGCAVM
eukprot:m.10381 g.10381  ORF g.10381 m.10381 type:complete len:192 (-) comp5556_c0_seq2:453-1028(-)